MIHFGRTRSVNFYDKNSTIVLFTTFHCRGVEKARTKMTKDPVAGNKKCVHYFNSIFLNGVI